MPAKSWALHEKEANPNRPRVQSLVRTSPPRDGSTQYSHQNRVSIRRSRWTHIRRGDILQPLQTNPRDPNAAKPERRKRAKPMRHPKEYLRQDILEHRRRGCKTNGDWVSSADSNTACMISRFPVLNALMAYPPSCAFHNSSLVTVNAIFSCSSHRAAGIQNDRKATFARNHPAREPAG